MSGYISKDELAKAVYLSMHNNPHKDGKIRVNHNNEHMHFVHMIYHAPNADVRPVIHGYWEVGGVQPWNGVVGNWVCSVCGRVSLDNDPFCPKCGATMDFDEEGTE